MCRWDDATHGGLSVGHALFNLRAPIAESADPCCAASAALGLGSINGNTTTFGRQAVAPLLAEATIRIPVGGMSCEACTLKIQRALVAVEGVVSARVSLAEGVAEVCGARGDLPEVAPLLEAVRAAGYQA